MSVEQPEVGTRVRDTKAKRIGIVMDRSPGGTVWLRPERGGREWTASSKDIEPADLLSAKLAAVNTRSRTRLS